MGRLVPLLTASLLVGAPAGAPAKVYKWVDENGTVHFSQDPNTLPESSLRGDGKLESFEFQKRAPAPTEEEEAPAGEHSIRMRSTGHGNHVVFVRLNGRVTVPMLLDTGASDVVITRETAALLGFDERDYLAYQTYETANGSVSQPTVRFFSVAVGSAEARLVKGSISDSMQIGLLGTSFLQEFEYSIRGSELVLRNR